VSSKINVNPDHYKTRGRERQGEDIVQEVHRQNFAEQRREARRQSRAQQQPGDVPTQTSRKSGVASTSQKRDNTRHGESPEPAANKVPGAFGRERPEAPDPAEKGE
jgi:hypothetical protein